ncbi:MULTISPECIES: amino acid ABC transporter substrate-binding protein [unclassified Acinetobacter]|uniref:amino acid ABC transporter substrate-binding protein n=1 Tax=unclassified Acinetobacter TaxID=196816 RepID=UPI0015D46079|nr:MULTISPECIES: amino acid ABC transporter substrate-binding protein [unclassified Acinetobacter]
MARPYEQLSIWIQDDRELKEKFIRNNAEKWKLKYPYEFYISSAQQNNLGPSAEVATLKSKEILTVSKQVYELIRKKFREFKYQKNHKSKGHLQARISTDTKSKLENIKRKLERGNTSITLEHVIKNFDEDTFKLKLKVEDLQEQLKKAKNDEALLNKKSEEKLKMQQAYDKKIQEYLFNQWIFTTLKLKILDQHISTQDDIDRIYESFDKIEKEAAQAEIITELKYRLEDEILNIKASLKPASDEVIPLNVSTSPIFHENTITPIKPSGYTKGLSTPHECPVSENPPEEHSDTEYPTIKTNAEYLHLREEQWNPLKRNTKN